MCSHPHMLIQDLHFFQYQAPAPLLHVNLPLDTSLSAEPHGPRRFALPENKAAPSPMSTPAVHVQIYLPTAAGIVPRPAPTSGRPAVADLSLNPLPRPIPRCHVTHPDTVG